MKLFNEKAMDLVNQYVVAECEKIVVQPGLCRFNYKCQMNAVHEALLNKDEKIAMVFYYDYGKRPILHFINVDKDGIFVDNTLGQWTSSYEYYFIRFIYKESFRDINQVFSAYRNQISRRLPWYIRLFNNQEW